MLLYLDQNKLIELRENPTLLRELKKVLRAHDIQLGISFYHLVETSKIEADRWREGIVEVVQSLPYIQLRVVIHIFEDEVRNEFYRYLGLTEKISEIKKIGRIFEKGALKDKDFRSLVEETRKKPNLVKTLIETIRNNDLKIRAINNLEDFNGFLKIEKDGILDWFIAEFLDQKNMGLSIHLPPRSLSNEDFKASFNFDNCPYLKAYLYMFVRRYLDKERIKKATGDLPDFEHAILGSMTCNYVILEKNMAAIITHSRKELGENIRAKVFKETKKFIESLS